MRRRRREGDMGEWRGFEEWREEVEEFEFEEGTEG